jgi:hypothetical protein
MTNSPTDWHWNEDNRLICGDRAFPSTGDRSSSECTDEDVLENALRQIIEIRDDYQARADRIGKSEKTLLLKAIEDKEKQIDYIQNRLEFVKQWMSENFDRPSDIISPEKKRRGRGKNKVSASGSLIPTVQKKRDRSGRIIEYPKVEGVRVPRSEAFSHPEQFNWQYCYSVKSDERWRTKKISVPTIRVLRVRDAIEEDKPVSYILGLISRKK